MFNSSINLFYHPTTTLFLDDDRDFFSSIYFKIAKHIRCKYFDSPEVALSMSQLPFKNFQLNYPEDAPSNTPVHDALFNSFKPLDKRRFLEPSVIVVDYDMPDIDGLEVCRRITNPYIKKILLTGVADEKVAIEALNEGVIDYYIHKQEENLVQRLVDVIKKQQQKYFNDLIKNYPIYCKPPYITDPVFIRYLIEVCVQNNIVEYYFMDNPMGYLLINKQGQILVLLAYTEEEVEVHIDDCQNQSAPKLLLVQLTSRQSIPFFHDSIYSCYDKTMTDWTTYMHSATKVEGKETYYCSLLKNLSIEKLLSGYKNIILANYNDD